MAAPGGNEPDYLLDLWESTAKELEENREFARAEQERIGPEKSAELSNCLARIKKEDLELKRQEYEEERNRRLDLKEIVFHTNTSRQRDDKIRRLSPSYE